MIPLHAAVPGQKLRPTIKWQVHGAAFQIGYQYVLMHYLLWSIWWLIAVFIYWNDGAPPQYLPPCLATSLRCLLSWRETHHCVNRCHQTFEHSAGPKWIKIVISSIRVWVIVGVSAVIQLPFRDAIQILNLGVRNMRKSKCPWIVETPSEALGRMNHDSRYYTKSTTIPHPLPIASVCVVWEVNKIPYILPLSSPLLTWVFSIAAHA